ncbi:unnamed protein product [Peniophora sp. CBMAI 1063]|nr:unnamed protein product [Peniophora sp. CBMAI 1063]
MGASQSRTEEPDEKVFYNEVPIQISGELVSKLADKSESSDVPPARQSLLDSAVRARIDADVARLKEEEETVQREIEAALERENLDRERSMAGASDEPGAGDVKSSAVLMEDLEEIRQKVERYNNRRELAEHPELKAKSEAVVECYTSHPRTTLDCWREVEEFHSAVADVEHKYVASLR